MTQLKTRKQFREECAKTGTPLSHIARRYGFSSSLFYEIVHDDDENPRRKCQRGQSHDIAVAIGIKEGVISTPPVR